MTPPLVVKLINTRYQHYINNGCYWSTNEIKLSFIFVFSSWHRDMLCDFPTWIQMKGYSLDLHYLSIAVNILTAILYEFRNSWSSKLNLAAVLDGYNNGTYWTNLCRMLCEFFFLQKYLYIDLLQSIKLIQVDTSHSYD